MQQQLTDAQYKALEAVYAHYGRLWKSQLRKSWETGKYSYLLQQHQSELQQIRNDFGPSWLSSFRFES